MYVGIWNIETWKSFRDGEWERRENNGRDAINQGARKRHIEVSA
jgi:hypothetical protein